MHPNQHLYPDQGPHRACNPGIWCFYLSCPLLGIELATWPKWGMEPSNPQRSNHGENQSRQSFPLSILSLLLSCFPFVLLESSILRCPLGVENEKNWLHLGGCLSTGPGEHIMIRWSVVFIISSQPTNVFLFQGRHRVCFSFSPFFCISFSHDNSDSHSEV